MEDKPDGQMLLTIRNTIDIEGEEKPALVAESLAMLVPPAPEVMQRP